MRYIYAFCKYNKRKDFTEKIAAHNWCCNVRKCEIPIDSQNASRKERFEQKLYLSS